MSPSLFAHPRRLARSAAAVTALVAAVSLVATAAPATAAPTTGATITLPATAVHDAAYSGRYFLNTPTAARATMVVLQRVVADTFTVQRSAPVTAVESELGALRSALTGSDGDLRRFGPTTPQQISGAIGVLLASARTAGHTGVTTAAQADVAADLYRDYLGGAGDGYADDLDEFAGAIADPTVGDAGVHDSAGAVFASLEQDALRRTLGCARIAACATVVDWLQQSTVGVSVTTSAATLASDPTVANTLSTLGLTVHADGSASGTADAATSGAVQVVAQVRTATGTITGSTDSGGAFHPGEVGAIDAQQPSIAAQASDPSKQQAVVGGLKSWLSDHAGALTTLALGATVAVYTLKFLGSATGTAFQALGTALSGAVEVFEGAVSLVDSLATAGGVVVSSLGKATMSLAQGNIIGAVSDVFGMFSSPQPDPVFQAVQQVQQQVADLQKSMDARFDRVDAALGDIMTTVQQGFATVDALHDQVTGDFATTFQRLDAAQASVNRLSQQFTAYFSDSIRADTQALIDHYDSYRERYGTAMTQQQFSDGESALYTAATTDAAETAVAGDFGLATDDVSVANQLGAYPLDKVRSWLDVFSRRWPGQSPAGSVSMVNPDDWARAALAYRQLLDENPRFALAMRSTHTQSVQASGAAVQVALTGLASNSDGTAPVVDTTAADLASTTQGLATALDGDANAYLGANAHGLDAWGGSEQNVNPVTTLDGRCGQPASTPAAPADDPSLANRAVPNGLRVAAQAGAERVAICWAAGAYDELDEQNCHVVRGDLLCSSTADYRRSATVQFSPDGTTWTTLTTLTQDYGRYTMCSDNPDGTSTCWPDSRYIPAWSTSTRDTFLAQATRVTDPNALAAVEAASTNFLVTLQKNLFTKLAGDVGTGALLMPSGYVDAGSDAARAQSGAFVLARAATVLAAPSAASGDQFVRTSFWGGSEQLPNNATADGSAGGPLYQRLVAAAANPPATRSAAYADWLTAGAARVTQVRDQVDATMRALAASGYRDRSVLVETVEARLTAGDATLRQSSWSVTPATWTAPSTAVGSSASVTLHVTNTSNGVVLARFTPTLSGTGAAAWAVTANTCAAVAPTHTCSITVRFTPTGTARSDAALNLPLPATGVGPVSVPLTGRGH